MAHVSKPTTLDYAILGLLKDGPLSGYRIRKIFETSAMGNYSSSPGTIYPALKRLERLALVSKENNEENKKSQFSLTAAGKQALIDWMRQDISTEDVSKKLSELMLRFAFQGGYLNGEDQLRFLEQMISQLKLVISGMEAFYDKRAETMPIHGRLAFESGIQTYQCQLDWAKNALKEIKNTNTDG